MTLKPADEIAYRRYVESLADFDEVHEVPASMLAEDPDRGRRIADGRRRSRLARKEKPTMAASHTSDDGEVSTFTPEAS